MQLKLKLFLESAKCGLELSETVNESDNRIGMVIRDAMLRMAGNYKNSSLYLDVLPLKLLIPSTAL